MIKLLIVEDSPTVLGYLKHIFSNDPDIEVVGTVRNGKEAVEFVRKNKVNVISMDIDMPVMNGLQATKIIMSENPVPIIIVTGSRNAKKDDTSMEALAAGALSVIQKPFGIGHKMQAERSANMIRMIKTLSKVKVITRKFTSEKTTERKPVTKTSTGKIKPASHQLKNKKYVAIGISSGGPRVLAKVFSEISADFPYPILVVQHITRGFIATMVSWLNDILEIPVTIASHNETLKPGQVYFAPDEYNMGVKYNKINLSKCNSGTIICPSVKYLFENLAMHSGNKTIAIILTGMGSDGSAEIKKLKDAGALTIAQDEESSLVHGMPGEAIRLGGVDYVLNTENITELFRQIERVNPRQKQ